MPHTYFNRLPPNVRETILTQLSGRRRDQPVSIAEVVHMLGDHYHGIDMSEASLKSSIAEAALERGFVVAFDGT